MKIDRKELKQAAKRNLRESRPSPLKVTFLFLLLTTVISLVVDFVVTNPAATIYRVLYTTFITQDYEQLLRTWVTTGTSMTMLVIFLNVLIFLYSSVMSFGYYSYSLRRTDGENTAGGDLLCGFSQVGRVIVMQLVVTGFTIVWAFATVVPATMIGTMFLFGIILIFGDSVFAMVLSICVFYVLIIIAAIFTSYLTMRYVLAPFILADDPTVSGMDAVRRSRALMSGRLGEGFLLSLSFLGWSLLRAFIVGVVVFAVFFIAGVLYFASMNPIALVVGAYVLTVIGTLVTLPFNMWYLSYYYGTFAQYYRAISPRQTDAQRLLEADRPEPF